MKKNLFVILAIVLFVGGNILSYYLNDRMLKPMTNVLAIGMIIISYMTRKV